MDVMLYEVFAEEEAALRQYLPPDVRAAYAQHTIQAAPAPVPPAQLIAIRTQSVIPPAWARELSGVLTRSTGYDHLLAFQAQCGRAMPCGYLPAYCARSVAEHALLTILALLRKLPQQLQQFRTFNRNALTGRECFGRHLLVVGVGNIGTEIVRLATGMGLRVKGMDLVQQLRELEYVALADGLRWAEIIVCALPLTPLTRGMLNYERLRTARPGALFINIGRGEIAPSCDLQRLIDAQVLGGVGLDIYEDEPALAEHLRAQQGQLTASGQAILALHEHPQVLCTPHNAFNTREALDRKAQHSAASIRQWLAQGTFPYPVPA